MDQCSISCTTSWCQAPFRAPHRSSMRLDQYAGHSIVSNFWLCSHLQLPTVARTSSAPMLPKPNLIYSRFRDWPSRLFLHAPSTLLYHLLADRRVSVYIENSDRHWWKLCHPVFYLLSAFASHTHDTCYFNVEILNEATASLPSLRSLLWPLPPPFTFKYWQRVRPPCGW